MAITFRCRHLNGESKTVSVGSVSRIPAADIEDIIVRSVNEHLVAQHGQPSSSSAHANDRGVIKEQVVRIDVHKDRLMVWLKSAGNEESHSTDGQLLSIPWRKPPSRKSRQILIPLGVPRNEVRPTRIERRARLVGAISRGRRWLDEIVSGSVTNIEQIATIASRMAEPRLQLRTGPNRPDAMQKKRRNGRASTKTSVEDEIAHLRGLDLGGLRARWQGVFRRPAPAHLTRHLVFAVIAYRLQADRFGDLDHATLQVLDRTVAKEKGPAMSARLTNFDQKRTELSPGTVLVREWDRQSQRVMVMADGFAWNGQTYDSLSKVAFAITGTKWNGPRFFGLRDKEDRPAMEARP
jgi:DUF2924 family protein